MLLLLSGVLVDAAPTKDMLNGTDLTPAISAHHLAKRGNLCSKSSTVEADYECPPVIPSVDDCAGMIAQFGALTGADSLFYSDLGATSGVTIAKQWYCSNIRAADPYHNGAARPAGVAYDGVSDNEWYAAQAAAMLEGNL